MTTTYIDPEVHPDKIPFPKFTFSAETLPAIRGATTALFSKPFSTEGVKIEEKRIPGPSGAPDVRVLTYARDPAPTSPVPALLWIHGGGYILGIPEMDNVRISSFAKQLGIIVVSVDYRLAPEFPYPAPVEDCYAALKWMNVNAGELGIDVNSLAIGGASAGGGLTASLALLARDRQEYKIAFQILIYPMLDDRTTTAAETGVRTGEYLWTAEQNKFGWKALLGGIEPGSDNVPIYAAPARAKSLEGLPPAFIPVGELDLFREENIAYAQRLWAAGVSTELHVVPGAFHGFDAVSPEAYITQQLVEHLVHVLKRSLLDRKK